MKIKIRYKVENRQMERIVNYIPSRYIIAIAFAVLETLAILAIVVGLSNRFSWFMWLVRLTEIACVIQIIASNDNPDYKVPWLLFVLIVPVAGFMMYFMFYSRTLKKKYVRRLEQLKNQSYQKDDGPLFARLRTESVTAHNQARMLCDIAQTHLFTDTRQEYFPVGEKMHARMLEDLRQARKFILLEYFIIEDGVFWRSILDILKEKAAQGVSVKVVYDDIGCMLTLPGNYDRILKRSGIEAVPFSKLKGNADSEFNNRSHRKIMVIDGTVGYTGGINLADEYINEIERFGHWKDVGVRLEGDGVKELTKLFLIDFGLNRKEPVDPVPEIFPACSVQEPGYLIPFGDGPNPIYKRRVGKCVIQNMLNQARRYVYIMSPYLIVDNELCMTMENAALRGVDVKLILPHIPDKKIVFEMARSYYKRLMAAGVSIYEYEPGFVHAKCYLADGEYAMVGTINLDYRSLVHHFENGVWMYRCRCLEDIRADFDETLQKCIHIDETMTRWTLLQRFFRAVMKLVAPML